MATSIVQDRDRYWSLKSDATTPRDLLTRLNHGSRILEVGCGTGLESSTLASLGFKVQAIDTDVGAVEQARERHFDSLRPSFMVQDFSKHQFVDEFDAVFERGVLHNIKSDGDRNDFAEKVARALKPGGLWFDISGCADDRRHGRNHGCIFLTHIVTAVEPLFEILSIERRPYGQIEAGFDFDGWYCVFRRR
jgi:2-polyprenyl-3-methyl-5-hydroxy-6-metoxy-1,4-benzoquinol methylase